MFNRLVKYFKRGCFGWNNLDQPTSRMFKEIFICYWYLQLLVDTQLSVQ